jgi:hypothetical protein
LFHGFPNEKAALSAAWLFGKKANRADAPSRPNYGGLRFLTSSGQIPKKLLHKNNTLKIIFVVFLQLLK